MPPEIWAHVEQTYVGARVADNWDALAHTLALFRQVAIEVGTHLGYAHPHELHQRVSAYSVRSMTPIAGAGLHNREPVVERLLGSFTMIRFDGILPPMSADPLIPP